MRTPRPFLRAFKVLDEGLLEVLLVADAIFRQAVKPCPRRALEHQWKVAEGDALVAPTNVGRYKVVSKPDF